MDKTHAHLIRLRACNCNPTHVNQQMAHAVYVTHYMDTRIPGRPDATLIILHAHTIKVMQFTHTNELNNIACI